jgi:hypothetical protein
MIASKFEYKSMSCQVKNWTFDRILFILRSFIKNNFDREIVMRFMQSIENSRAAFIGAFTAAAFAAGTAATTLTSSPAYAQDQVAAVPGGVDLRGAIIESRKGLKDHGGYLVIWYDARHQWDAERLVLTLKDMGKENVVALPGRTDGMFQLMAGGRMDRNLYDLNDARSGRLGATAINFANQRNIAYMEFEDGAPDIVHELDRRLS